MSLSSRPAPSSRSILQTAFLAAIIVSAASVCCAGTLQLTYYVPASEEGKSPPGGWGALVLTFDTPINSASFTFGPACPTPLPGNIDPTSDNETVQVGPGGYGLGQTGTEVQAGPFAGQNYGYLNITIDYTGDPPPPNITDAFWQYKTKVSGNPTWTFNPSQDMGAPLPEPSSLLLAAGAGVALVALMGRRLLKRR
jgi:hypothetical protein